VARTHTNLMFELDSLTSTLGLDGDDRVLGVTPFSHVNGLVRSMLASLRVGGTLVPLRHFRRQLVVDTIRRQRISVFIGVPFMFGILAETRARDADLSSLRLCISASAAMPVPMNRRFHDRHGRYVRQLYGSTETGTISVNLAHDIESTLESVGRPIAGVEIALRREDGAVAEPGETGEVAVRSPAAITQYDGAAAEPGAFRNGYFLTGDLGHLDEQGQLYLVGRKRFLINKGGYKINPCELETLLREHPKIREAVVIGIPTAYGDEQVKAVLVPSSPCSEGEVIDYCRGRIADFKVPSVIEFRPSLPTTPTGKVLRTKLT
jgi:long-chain acyl-CoA synthetase